MLIGMVGLIGAGKNTVGNTLVSEYSFTTDSFASTVKDILAVIFGWERSLLEGDTAESRDFRNTVDEWWESKLGIKGFTPRLAMQMIGTGLFRKYFNEDIWTIALQNRLRKLRSSDVVITDVRYKNEAQLITENGGVLIRVVRGNLPEWWKLAELYNTDDITMQRYVEYTFQRKYQYVHTSEWMQATITTQYTIHNDADITTLADEVHKLVSIIR